MITLMFMIMMIVLFFKFVGFMLKLGWKIAGGIFGFIGFLIMAGLVISFIGTFLLPLLVIGGLIGLGVYAIGKAG